MYLITSRYIAINPINKIELNIPLVLYFIIKVINATPNISETTIANFNIVSFVMFELINSLPCISYSIGNFPVFHNVVTAVVKYQKEFFDKYGAGLQHICINVENYDAVTAHMKACGAETLPCFAMSACISL